MLLKIRIAFLLVLLLVTVQTWAKDRPFIDEPDNTIRHDFEESEWQEGEIKLPAGYDEKNLQEFQLDSAQPRFRYFIDRTTLQTSEDGVTRFLLAIRSSNGAINTSYEGVRCGKREYKVYAYGSAQGFKRLPTPVWRHIPKSGQENYRHTLYSDLLCDLNTGTANPPQRVFRAMQTHKSVDHFFFNPN